MPTDWRKIEAAVIDILQLGDVEITEISGNKFVALPIKDNDALEDFCIGDFARQLAERLP